MEWHGGTDGFAAARVARFALVSDGEYAAAVEAAASAGELRGVDGERLGAADADFIAAGLRARRRPVRITTFRVDGTYSDGRRPDSVTVPTGVRCEMAPGWVLMLGPKSGKGCRFRVMLRNTIGFVDADYYFSDNEGHIILKLINDNYDGLSMDVRAGDALVQGLFVPHGVTVDDDADGVRNGGFGSTVR